MNEYFNRGLTMNIVGFIKKLPVQLLILLRLEDDLWFLQYYLFGEFIKFITNNTGNSSKFWDFLRILKYAIKYTKMKHNNKCLIMLDNEKIHHSEQTTKTIKEL